MKKTTEHIVDGQKITVVENNFLVFDDRKIEPTTLRDLVLKAKVKLYGVERENHMGQYDPYNAAYDVIRETFPNSFIKAFELREIIVTLINMTFFVIDNSDYNYVGTNKGVENYNKYFQKIVEGLIMLPYKKHIFI